MTYMREENLLIGSHIIAFYLNAFFWCFFICWLIILTKRWHGRFTFDSHLGVQKVHDHPTPRIGGIAVALSLVISIGFLSPKLGILSRLFIASMPIFIFGLIEDITKKVGVRERFLASIVSGLLACWLMNTTLTRLNIYGLDDVLQFIPISIVFTVCSVSGLINAINIIDGFNGLASGVSLIICLSIAAISFRVNDTELMLTSLTIAFTVIGFMAANYPYGKIFLGDCGAYLVGFLIAWLAILLPMHHANVSPWASLLICFYPIMETVFSIFRRWRRKHHPAHPDRLHLHSLVKARFINHRLAKYSPTLRNAAVAPILWLYTLSASMIAIFFFDHMLILISTWLILFFVYIRWYKKLIAFGRKKLI